MLSDSGLIASIQGNCEDPIKDSIINYAAYYDKRLYSWHECSNYWWAFNAVDDCQIDYIEFNPNCAGSPFS